MMINALLVIAANLDKLTLLRINDLDVLGYDGFTTQGNMDEKTYETKIAKMHKDLVTVREVNDNIWTRYVSLRSMKDFKPTYMKVDTLIETLKKNPENDGPVLSEAIKQQYRAFDENYAAVTKKPKTNAAEARKVLEEDVATNALLSAQRKTEILKKVVNHEITLEKYNFGDSIEDYKNRLNEQVNSYNTEVIEYLKKQLALKSGNDRMKAIKLISDLKKDSQNSNPELEKSLNEIYVREPSIFKKFSDIFLGSSNAKVENPTNLQESKSDMLTGTSKTPSREISENSIEKPNFHAGSAPPNLSRMAMREPLPK